MHKFIKENVGYDNALFCSKGLILVERVLSKSTIIHIVI